MNVFTYNKSSEKKRWYEQIKPSLFGKTQFFESRMRDVFILVHSCGKSSTRHLVHHHYHKYCHIFIVIHRKQTVKWAHRHTSLMLFAFFSVHSSHVFASQMRTSSTNNTMTFEKLERENEMTFDMSLFVCADETHLVP